MSRKSSLEADLLADEASSQPGQTGATVSFSIEIPQRNAFEEIVEHPIYIYLGLILSIITAIGLAPYNSKTPALWQKNYHAAEYIISIYFVADLPLTIMAYGWRNYFSTPKFWPSLIQSIAAISFYALIPVSHEFKANFNCVRILRIIAFVPMIPAFREARYLFLALEESLGMLGDVLVLIVYFLILGALFGMQLMSHRLQYRCINDMTGEALEDACDPDRGQDFLLKGKPCPSGFICSNEGEPIEGGTVSFDNILVALLSTFRVMTIEGWSPMMHYGRGAIGPVAVIYFVALIIFGAYVLMQLIPSVIAGKLTDLVESRAQWETAAPKLPIHFSLKDKWQKLHSSPAWVTLSVVNLVFGISIEMIESFHSPAWTHFVYQICFIITTTLFGIEILVSFLARDRGFVMVEFAIFVVLVADIFFTHAQFGAGGLRAISLFKLEKNIPVLHRLKCVLIDTRRLLLSFFVVWLLTILMFTELGMQLFSEKLRNEDDPSVSTSLNYDSLGYGAITTFQIFSVENWNDLEASIVSAYDNLWADLYTVGTLIFGGFLVSQMLLPIIISGFQNVLNEELEEESGPLSRLLRTMTFAFATRASAQLPLSFGASEVRSFSTIMTDWMEQPKTSLDRDQLSLHLTSATPAPVPSLTDLAGIQGYSCFIFSVTNPIRIRFFKLSKLPFWPYVNNVISLLSFLHLVVYTDKYATGWALYADEVMGILLFLNVFVYGVSYGVFFGERPIFKNPWFLLDFCACICNVAGVWGSRLTASDQRMGVLRSCRLLKAFSFSETLRRTAYTVIRTIPVLATICLPYFVYLIVFATIGLHNFQGRLYSCEAEEAECPAGLWKKEGICEATKVQCPEGYWRNYRFNYDNIAQSLFSVWVISFQEGWPDDMTRLMDVDMSRDCRVNQTSLWKSAQGFDCPPKHLASPFNAVFSSTTEFLGQWLLVAVITGAILDNIKRIEPEIEGFSLLALDGKQKTWFQTLQIITQSYPKPSALWGAREGVYDSQWRLVVAKWMAGYKHKCAVTTVTLLNLLFLALCIPTDQLSGLTTFQYAVFATFLVIFTCECILLLWVTGKQIFNISGWNYIFVGSLVVEWLLYTGYITGITPGGQLLFTPSIVRAARILRYFQGMGPLFKTLVVGSKNMINVFFLMVVTACIFAEIGQALFQKLDVEGAKSLNSDVNFSSFGLSLMSVFVIATGEDWPGIMRDCMTHELGGTPWAVFYFICLHLLFNFALVNILTAVVVDTYLELLENDKTAARRLLLNAFNQEWIYYDVLAIKWITAMELPLFFERMDYAIKKVGINKGELEEEMKSLLAYDGMVHYIDVLYLIFKVYMGADLPGWAMEDILGKCKHVNASVRFQQCQKQPVLHLLAAQKIQAVFRGNKAREITRFQRAGLGIRMALRVDTFRSSGPPAVVVPASQGGHRIISEAPTQVREAVGELSRKMSDLNLLKKSLEGQSSSASEPQP